MSILRGRVVRAICGLWAVLLPLPLVPLTSGCVGWSPAPQRLRRLPVLRLQWPLYQRSRRKKQRM
jgi:hypothetical protein